MKLNDKFQLLMTDEEKRTFADAARRAGLSLSAWIRQVCREHSGMPHVGATEATH